MAVYHRFLKNSTSKFVKNHFKMFDGSTTPEALTPLPSLIPRQPNPRELNQQQQQPSILDLLRKSHTPWHLDRPLFDKSSEASDILPLHSKLITPHGFPQYPEEICGSPKLPEDYQCESKVLEESESGAVDLGKGLKIWADSVKRKRRKKMNKHKYKKLRKLLHRKT